MDRHVAELLSMIRAGGPVGQARVAGAPLGPVLIDGRAGSGKTTLSEQLAEELGGRVVHLDEVYPGWSGLAEGSALVPHPLLTEGRWQQYDWALERLNVWHQEDLSVPLIVEGCGALTPESRPLAGFAIWVEAPDVLRKQRALDRDGDHFRPFWEMWADQEEQHYAGGDFPGLADAIVTVGNPYSVTKLAGNPVSS